MLNADVDQTIGPNLQDLSQMGFAKHELRKLIVFSPQALLHSSIPRIEFWRTLLHGDTRRLLLAFTRNQCLINFDIDKNVIPKIILLKDYDLSESQIGTIIDRINGIFRRSITSIEVLLQRVEELGFRRGSSVFVAGLVSLSCVSPDMFKAKIELFKSFGWTEREFITALNKYPCIVCFSDENIHDKIKFLMERAGCTQSYIVSRPKILSYSLENRLIPRLHVVEFLKLNELIRSKLDLYSIISYSEKKFMEKFVVQYKEVVPKIHQTYVAASKGQL